jgi:hypothetical protein
MSANACLVFVLLVGVVGLRIFSGRLLKVLLDDLLVAFLTAGINLKVTRPQMNAILLAFKEELGETGNSVGPAEGFVGRWPLRDRRLLWLWLMRHRLRLIYNDLVLLQFSFGLESAPTERGLISVLSLVFSVYFLCFSRIILRLNIRLNGLIFHAFCHFEISMRGLRRNFTRPLFKSTRSNHLLRLERCMRLRGRHKPGEEPLGVVHKVSLEVFMVDLFRIDLNL